MVKVHRGLLFIMKSSWCHPPRDILWWVCANSSWGGTMVLRLIRFVKCPLSCLETLGVLQKLTCEFQRTWRNNGVMISHQIPPRVVQSLFQHHPFGPIAMLSHQRNHVRLDHCGHPVRPWILFLSSSWRPSDRGTKLSSSLSFWAPRKSHMSRDRRCTWRLFGWPRWKWQLSHWQCSYKWCPLKWKRETE